MFSFTSLIVKFCWNNKDFKHIYSEIQKSIWQVSYNISTSYLHWQESDAAYLFILLNNILPHEHSPVTGFIYFDSINRKWKDTLHLVWIDKLTFRAKRVVLTNNDNVDTNTIHKFITAVWCHHINLNLSI